MVRSSSAGSQADWVLRLVSQICKRTNLQMDVYQRAIDLAEAEGRTEQVPALRRFLGLHRQDRKLLCELIDRSQSTGQPAGKPSVRDEGSRGWRCRRAGSGTGRD